MPKCKLCWEEDTALIHNQVFFGQQDLVECLAFRDPRSIGLKLRSRFKLKLRRKACSYGKTIWRPHCLSLSPIFILQFPIARGTVAAFSGSADSPCGTPQHMSLCCQMAPANLRQWKTCMVCFSEFLIRKGSADISQWTSEAEDCTATVGGSAVHLWLMLKQGFSNWWKATFLPNAVFCGRQPGWVPSVTILLVRSKIWVGYDVAAKLV